MIAADVPLLAITHPQDLRYRTRSRDLCVYTALGCSASASDRLIGECTGHECDVARRGTRVTASVHAERERDVTARAAQNRRRHKGDGTRAHRISGRPAMTRQTNPPAAAAPTTSARAPSTRTSPSSGRSAPITHRSSVVLPEPLASTMAVTCPAITVKVTPSRTISSPNRRVKPFHREHHGVSLICQA